MHLFRRELVPWRLHGAMIPGQQELASDHSPISRNGNFEFSENAVHLVRVTFFFGADFHLFDCGTHEMCARKWNWILEFGETGLVFTDGSWCPDGSTEPSFQGNKSRPPFTRPSPGTEVLSFPRRTPFG